METRHELVLLCAISLGISYCDRVNLSVAIIPMTQEYGYDVNEKALVLSSFFYGYIVSQVLGALLARQFGGHIVLGVACAVWSLATMVVPLVAHSMVQLVVVRIILGVAEGVSFPVVYHLFSLNVPKEERSRSMACVSAGVCFGALSSFILSPLLVASYGWRMVFYVFGGLGLIWVAGWVVWWSYHSATALAHTNVSGSSPKSLKNLVGSFGTELREFYTHLLQMIHSPLIRSIFWCHFCHNIGMPLPEVRRYATIMGFTGAAFFILCMATTRNQMLSIFYLCATLSANGVGPVAGYGAAKLDISLPDQTGRLQAASNTFATLAGIVGIPLVGIISERTGSWNWVFLTVSMVFCSAAAMFHINGRWNPKQSNSTLS